MKLLVALLFLFPGLVTAQVKLQTNPETSKYEATDVVKIDSIKASESYTKALEWVALNYKSANDVIQFQDPATSKIILKGAFSVGLFGKSGWIKHTLILEFKDGRYRYNYTDLTYFSAGSGEISLESSMFSKKRVISTTEAEISRSVASLEGYIARTRSGSEW